MRVTVFLILPELQAFVAAIIPLTVQIAATIAKPILSPRSIHGNYSTNGWI